MNKKVIEFKNVSVEYNGITALDEISFSVNENDFLAVIGPNGGGKTTLLKVMLRLISPSKGRVTLFENKYPNQKHLVGYVPQFTFFDQDFPITVLDAVLLGRLSQKKLFQFYSLKDRTVAEEAIQITEIEHLKNRKIGTLSGGERQRVFIARALASQPKLLLLDEPTSSVDQKMRTSLYDLLAKLKNTMTIVLVTHDVGIISSHIDKIACLNQRLYYHDSKEISHEALEATYHCPVDLIAHGLPHRVLKSH